MADIRIRSQLHRLDPPFDIHRSVTFRTAQQINIQASCSIKANVILNGRSSSRQCGISLGVDTYLKEWCYFDAYDGFIDVAGQSAFAQGTFIHGGGGVVIGRNVITGPHCFIVASNHRFDSLDYPIMLQGDSRRGITIGNNVWIGANAVILDGANIGDNCVVGAGTVVTKIIPANSRVFDHRQRIDKRIYDNEHDY